MQVSLKCGYDDIWNFGRLVIVSIYRYLPNIWFSEDISEHITTHSTHLKNPYLVVCIIF